MDVTRRDLRPLESIDSLRRGVGHRKGTARDVHVRHDLEVGLRTEGANLEFTLADDRQCGRLYAANAEPLRP